MPDLKLAKLPDRMPVKITIAASPELNLALQAYAALYRQTYGQQEPVAELIPYMLQSFLDGDRNFARSLKDGEVSVASEGSAEGPARGRRRGLGIESISNTTR
ncbi:MAG: DUF2274 domain-containing protein [Pseudomonadota bacterium]